MSGSCGLTENPVESGSFSGVTVDASDIYDEDLLPPVRRISSKLNLTGASIAEPSSPTSGRHAPAPSIELPNQNASYINHIALDIGGSLIKLIYFSPDTDLGETNTVDTNGYPSPSALQPRGGRLHFVKFETSRVEDCISFIEAKGLHRYRGVDGQKEMRVLATGGGAYKFADIFKERLGLVLEKQDEMSCAVAGCNFLLQAIDHEAFIYESGTTSFTPNIEDKETYPYLLVNIGSGVSIVKVTGDNQFERVSGSSLGGGTFWGLARLLTGVKDFDQILEMSSRGDNTNIDMLVGDIYGGRDYASIGLSATTIASSFAKVISNDKELSDYEPGDVAMALCRMIAYNIGQLAYMNAMRHGIKRIFFGGFFIRGHPYTMDTISFAIRFWSKGEMAAHFLRHEGFLGAVGAFLKVHPMAVPGGRLVTTQQPSKVRARFVERFSMGAPFAGGEVVGPPIRDVSEKVSWVEKFVALGQAAAPPPAASESAAVKAATTTLATAQPSALQIGADALSARVGRNASVMEPWSPATPSHMALHVGVLHYSPTLEPFPLLDNPVEYSPNSLDISEPEEWAWWLQVLVHSVPTLVEKAVASEGGGELSRRRAMAFGRAFSAHLEKLAAEPGCYGQLGLAELFEMREDCLREFGFADVYRLDKERENAGALAVLPDLLREMDGLPLHERLLSLIEGVLAANIFDWGSQACVALYRDATILDMYRNARRQLSKRPWLRDQFDVFADAILSCCDEAGNPARAPFRRVIMFMDNSGADAVLGMLPFARELLRLGCEVVLAANTLPAINDVTAPELRTVISEAARHCPIIKQARAAAIRAQQEHHGHIPPYPGALPCLPSSTSPEPPQPSQPPSRPASPESHTAWEEALHQSVSTHQLAQQSAAIQPDMEHLSNTTARDLAEPSPEEQLQAAAATELPPPDTPATPDVHLPCLALQSGLGAQDGTASQPSQLEAASDTRSETHQQPAACSNAAAAVPVEPKLFVLANGQGSPCLDLGRVPNLLAEACCGVDLVVIEGMGRAIHTNLHAKFRCKVLKLAMLKTERVAKNLFAGGLFDCVCLYDV